MAHIVCTDADPAVITYLITIRADRVNQVAPAITLTQRHVIYSIEISFNMRMTLYVIKSIRNHKFHTNPDTQYQLSAHSDLSKSKRFPCVLSK